MIARRAPLAVLLVAAIAAGGCGSSSGAEDTRAIEDGDLAARWAGTQYTVAIFERHCQGKQAPRRTLEQGIAQITKAAEASTTDYQREYTAKRIGDAVAAIACEPELARQLASAGQ